MKCSNLNYINPVQLILPMLGDLAAHYDNKCKVPQYSAAYITKSLEEQSLFMCFLNLEEAHYHTLT